MEVSTNVCIGRDAMTVRKVDEANDVTCVSFPLGISLCRSLTVLVLLSLSADKLRLIVARSNAIDREVQKLVAMKAGDNEGDGADPR